MTMRRVARLAVVILVVASCKARSADKAPPPGSGSAAPGRAAIGKRPVVRHPPTAIRPEQLSTRPATATAWSAAETGKTADAWDAAAAAYERELDDCADDCIDPAYAVVLARKNALLAAPIDPPPGDEPVALPPRVQAVVDALDRYVAMADPADPDVAGMQFLAANALRRWRQPDAIARFEAVLRDHRDDPTAEYAANQLLEALMTSGRTAELKAWVNELLADPAFLAGKDALRATLERLRAATGP